MGLAVAARLLGRLDEAAQLYLQVLKLEPDLPEALWNDGLLAHVYQADYERANKRWSHLRGLLAPESSSRYPDLDTRLAEVEKLAEEERKLAADLNSETQKRTA